MEINLLAVLASGVGAMVIGSMWYSPLMFGNFWVKKMGFKESDMEKAKAKGMHKEYALNFVAALVTAYILGHFVTGLAVQAAFETTFWIWLGFVATSQMGASLWEGKPWSLYFLNIAYWAVNMAMMTGIFVMWG